MFNRFLFKPINNVSLVLFRIILGALIAIESFGAIATGWVKRVFIEPQFTFSFIGFEWLQPFEGYGMYYYYIIMGLLGICISAGYKYRWSMLSFCFALVCFVSHAKIIIQQSLLFVNVNCFCDEFFTC